MTDSAFANVENALTKTCQPQSTWLVHPEMKKLIEKLLNSKPLPKRLRDRRRKK